MSQSADHLRGIALAAGGMVLISPDGLLFRLTDASDMQILFWRGLISFAAVATYVQLSRPGGMAAAVGRAGWAGILSAALMSGSILFFTMSITRTTVANTLVILAAIPLFAAILGWVFLRERVDRATWLAIFATFLGILLVISGSLGTINLLGDALAIGAGLCMAANLTLIRARAGISMLSSLALSGLLVALLVLPFVGTVVVPARDFAIIAAMGLLPQSLAFGLFLAGARYLPPAEIGLFALLETVLGPFWTWLGVGEMPTPQAIIGGAVVIATLASHSAFKLRRAQAKLLM
ncbi:MAG: DMT family transporter [Alphaproteobacteria bacterium]|nr:DMT family transporter [Alphaproteobacteria bacterium]